MCMVILMITFYMCYFNNFEVQILPMWESPTIGGGGGNLKCLVFFYVLLVKEGSVDVRSYHEI